MNKRTLLYILGGIAGAGIAGAAIYYATSGALFRGAADLSFEVQEAPMEEAQIINVPLVTQQTGISCSGSPNPALPGQAITWTMTVPEAAIEKHLGSNLPLYHWQGGNLNAQEGKVVSAIYTEDTTQVIVTPYVELHTGPDKYENAYGTPCSVTFSAPEPEIVLPQASCAPDTPVASVGNDVTWAVTWDQPGVIGVNYTWHGEGLTTGTVNPITTQYVTPGLKSAEVTVDFGQNGKYTHDCEGTVTIKALPELSCAPAKSSYKTGEEVTWSVTFENVNYPANVTYKWSTGEEALGLMVLKKTYTTAGQQSMTVKVDNFEQGQHEATCSVNIVAETPQPQPQPEPEPEVTTQETLETQEPEITPVLVEEQSSKCQGLNYPNDIQGHWAESFIRQAYDQCLLMGYEDGSFRPDQPVTRAEAVKMVLSAVGIPPKSGCYDADCGSPFMDLDAWQGPWIRGAWDLNIVEGYSEVVFGPNLIITRAEAAALVARAFSVPPHEGCYTANCGAGHPNNFFLDIVDMWQGPWVRALWDKGWVTGTGTNKFEPNRPMTRGELTKLIQTARGTSVQTEQ